MAKPLLPLRKTSSGRAEPASGSRQPDAELEQYYSIRSVADALDVSPRTVSRYVERGQLKACRLGGLVRIGARDLQAFLTSKHPD